MKRTWLILASIPLIVAACGSAAGGPPQAIEAYLEALVVQDQDAVVNLSCADWEEQAITEVDSFEAVEAELTGVSCQEIGTSGDFTLVECTGAISVTYDAETQELALEGRIYQVLEEGGQWRMCGYQF